MICTTCIEETNRDEEDIDMLTFAVLEQLDRKEILELIHEMDDQELTNLMGLYIIESLKGKFAQNHINASPTSSRQETYINSSFTRALTSKASVIAYKTPKCSPF